MAPMEALDLNSIARLLWRFCQDEQIEFERFSHALQKAYLPLLTRIYTEYQTSTKKPFIVGINAAQGSGKTTLSKLLVLLFKHCFKLNALTISLDDFYHSREHRKHLANTIHPLLKTRGVPGTHNLSLAIDFFELLSSSKSHFPIPLPAFDKATDQPLPSSQLQSIESVPDIVIFEGWCVGSTPQRARELEEPVNELEAVQDPEKEWREFVNQKLKEYQALFSLIDYLVFLKAPDFETIFDWRYEQEEKLRSKLLSSNNHLHPLIQNQLMDKDALEKFIMHFERITQHNLQVMPKLADIVISLNRYRSPQIV